VTAARTDLLQAAITKVGGTYARANRKRVDWCINALLAGSSLPSAIITLLSLHFFTGWRRNSKIITAILGFALIPTAVAPAIHCRTRRISDVHDGDVAPRHSDFTVAAGAALGLLFSLSSVRDCFFVACAANRA
jgi:uncharacterized membrane protein YfcA